MKIITILLLLFSVIHAFAVDKTPLPTLYTNRILEGWTIRVDNRLLQGETAVLGEKALKLLDARLVAIVMIVPEKALSKLRSVIIELDLNYGDLDSMQYHPEVSWLKENGYNEKLAKCVHIPSVNDFMDPYENHRMPWVVLHELAHAYHDQVLSFDDSRVQEAWLKFRDSGKYQSVLTSPGTHREHYGITNEKEFFAEMTEAYFGSNDFYPFVTGELKEAEPEIYALMADIWGPLPQKSTL